MEEKSGLLKGVVVALLLEVLVVMACVGIGNLLATV